MPLNDDEYTTLSRKLGYWPDYDELCVHCDHPQEEHNLHGLCTLFACQCTEYEERD